jgi:DNA-binding SARP family transcriptional activator
MRLVAGAPHDVVTDATVVRLLGRVSVSRSGVELAGFGSGPLLRLLTCLVLRPDAPVSRAELAFRLWPDSSEAQARTNLRKALHQLRQELVETDRFVEITSGAVRWLPDAAAHVDVVAFLAACDARDDRAAVESYGGVLLPGVYDDWVLEERTRLHGLACAALTRLVEDADQDQGARLAFALRLVELEPTSEWAHRQVIETHAERGDRASAIRAYHRCVEVLSVELGVEPAADTQALYRRLVPIGTPVALPRRAPLVGRDAEWAVFEHLWERATTDPMHLLVVTGEPGAGKSRFIAEFARHAQSEQALVLHARSHETVDTPWAPVASWLREDELLTLLADAPVEVLTEVSRLAPQLRERGDVPVPGPVVDELGRFQFTEALAKALLHGSVPRLLVLDDVQWCDAPTLGFVSHLLLSVLSGPALVVVLMRPEELDADHPILRLRDALAGEGRVTSVEVGRLTAEETAMVADAVAPTPLGAADHDRIWRESQGNPLFVVELAKSERPWDGEQVAPTVRAMIESRLRRLSAEARRVAETAAVLGGEFSFDELAAVADGQEQPHDELVSALDELWRRQIVAGVGGRYDFTHDRIREVAVAGLGAPRRHQLHNAIADALMTLQGADRQSGRVAVHLRASGRAAEAIEAFRRSARASLDLFDLDVAVDSLRSALDLVAELRGRDGGMAVERELLIDLGAVLVAREGYGSAEVREVYARAMALAQMHREMVDPAILRGLGLAAVVSCRFEEAERLGRLLITTIDDRVARTEGHYLLGVAAFWRGDLAGSARELEASLDAYDPQLREIHQARFAQDPYPVCLIRLALTRLWQGEHPAAVALADQALAWCERTGHAHSTAYVLAYAGMIAAEQRDVDRLRQLTRHGRGFWSEAQGFLAAFGPLYDGWCDALDGRAAATEQIDSALADWRRSGQVLHLTHGLVLRARAALMVGDDESAAAALQEARDRTEATGQDYLRDELQRLSSQVTSRR